MEKTLPIWKINHVPYLVDIDFDMLRQQANPEQVIEFSKLEDVGSHYRLIEGNAKPITIPYMVKLDPEGISRKYALQVKDLPKTDAELKCNPELLADRLQGKLPTINLAGHIFFVDLRLGLLRPKDDFSTRGIELSGLPTNPTGMALQFLYDAATHREVLFNENWKAIPRGIIALEIPGETVLDPIGTLNKYSPGLQDKYPFASREEAMAFDWEAVGCRQFIDKYPVRYNLEARVIPWERTLIPELIAGNNKAVSSR